jgi:hypothetical protein
VSSPSCRSCSTTSLQSSPTVRAGTPRIIKLPNYRIGDAGSLVLLQLCTEESAPKGSARRSAGLRRKRNERKHQFASQAIKGGGNSAKGQATASAAGEGSTEDGGEKSEEKASS